MSDLDLILDTLKALLPSTVEGFILGTLIFVLFIVGMGSLIHYIYWEYKYRNLGEGE